jgi:glucokinase
MILAGDIGGTKTLLALYEVDTGRVLFQKRFESASADQFDKLLADFLAEVGRSSFANAAITAAGFGIAGPVTGETGAQKVQATNLPWQMDSQEISQRIGGVPVVFANDLVASGTAAIASKPAARISLNPSAKETTGHAAVIAAGTGLGEALFYFDGQTHHPMPTEGGHGDFAPNNALEAELWAYLRTRLNGHVSYERIICGRGFYDLYAFVRDQGLAQESPHMIEKLAQAKDPSALITQQAVAGSDAISEMVCRLFARIYGAEAGNLALKSLPFGGVFIAGAIAGHILPFMQREFMLGFLDKGRFSELLKQIPVWVVSDPELALKGAAVLALKLRSPT